MYESIYVHVTCTEKALKGKALRGLQRGYPGGGNVKFYFSPAYISFLHHTHTVSAIINVFLKSK